MEEDIKVLEVADPVTQESLVSEVVPDPMEGEQTWPLEEELREAEVIQAQCVAKRVPTGTSEYQAAWIMDSEGSEEDAEEEEEDGSPVNSPTPLSEGEGEEEDEGEEMSIAGTDTVGSP